MDRLFVYVETPTLHRYMAGAAKRYGLHLDVDDVALHPADAARLPGTAARIIGTDLAEHHVSAHRLTPIDIDETLRLSVYLVAPLATRPDPVAAKMAAEDTKDHAASQLEPYPGESR